MASGGGKHDVQGSKRIASEITNELNEVHKLLREVERELRFSEGGIDKDDTLKIAISTIGLELSEGYNKFADATNKMNEAIAQSIIDAYNTGKELVDKAKEVTR